MENMDKKQGEGMGMDCGHGGCCGHMYGHCGGRHRLWHIVLKLIIVAIIFCFGYKLGVMTGYLRAGYGGQYGQEGNWGGWGMMRGYNYNAVTPPGTNGTTPTPVK